MIRGLIGASDKNVADPGDVRNSQESGRCPQGEIRGIGGHWQMWPQGPK